MTDKAIEAMARAISGYDGNGEFITSIPRAKAALAAYHAHLAARDAEIAAWLRSKDAYEMASQSDHGDLLTLADAIERGDYHKGETQ